MTRVNEMIELTFEGVEPAGSHVAVNVKAVFTKGDFSKEVLGFYAGNGTYKVRFLAEEAGRYTYQVSGLVSGQGTIDVEEADEKHHGIVRPDGTKLRHADGTYITTFGTTVYALAHQTDELTEETFKSLECGAFNKIRICLFPKHYAYNKNDHRYFPFYYDENGQNIEFTDNLGEKRSVKPIDTNHPCFEFWDEFEGKLNRLFDMGIQVDLILFHPYDRWGHSYMSQEANLTYLDFAIRRLAAFPNIWWSMANEYDLFFNWKIEQWHEVDEFIGKNDPYGHMLSNHNCFPLYDFERDAITHVSIQNRAMNRVKELQAKYNKPVCYDECAYEGNLKETWGSISAKEMVNRFWKVTVTGGFCTHGEVLLDDDIETSEQQDNAVLWWAKGGKLKGQSPERIKFLREVFESLPGPIEGDVVGLGRMLAMSDQEREMSLKYTPESMRGFIETIGRMDASEILYHIIPSFEYAGHCGENVFIFYLGTDCCARYMPQLPQGKTFTIEVVDAWNMTRSQTATGVKMGDEIRLPGHEYIAVIATAEN